MNNTCGCGTDVCMEVLETVPPARGRSYTEPLLSRDDGRTASRCIRCIRTRLRFNAFEPGFNPGTGLGRDANLFLRLIAKGILPLFAPFVKYWSTLGRAARVYKDPDRYVG